MILFKVPMRTIFPLCRMIDFVDKDLATSGLEVEMITALSDETYFMAL